MFVFNIYEFRVQFFIFILIQSQLSAINELTIKEGLFHNLAVSVYLPLVTVLSGYEPKALTFCLTTIVYGITLKSKTNQKSESAFYYDVKQTRRVQGRPLNCCTPNCQADAHSHGHQLPGMEGGHQDPAVRTWMANRSIPALQRSKQRRSKDGTLPTAPTSLAGHSPHHSGELPVPDETFALRRQWQMLGTNLQPLRAQKRPVRPRLDLQFLPAFHGPHGSWLEAVCQ